MRRLSAFLLALFLLLSGSVPVLAAPQGKLSLTGEATGLARGDQFSVHLEINRNPGVTDLLVSVFFDREVLELSSVTDLALLPGFSKSEEEGTLTLRWRAPAESTDRTETGRCAAILFRVKSDARLGESTVRASVNDTMLDAVNAAGKTVPFESGELSFSLECLHVTTETETVTEPTFSTAGEGKTRCGDCGKEWTEELLPFVTSRDGAVMGYVLPGEYTEEDGKSIGVEYLYGGEDVSAAKTFFGDSLIRSFRIRFQKNGSVFFPEGESKIRLKASFDLPEEFALYIMVDGTPRRVDAAFSDGVLTFPYSSYLFAAVSREAKLDPPLLPEEAPPVSLPAEEEALFSSRGAGEEGETEWLPVVTASLAALVFFAGGIVVLRRGKRNAL